MIYRIAGVVVLYNPDIGCIQNIYSYINQIDYLFAIDNSEIQNSIIVNELNKNPKIGYTFYNQNLGVAVALNNAAQLAIKNNFDFLLTMDQDTLADPELIGAYKNFLSFNKDIDIGMLTPVTSYFPEVKKVESETKEKELEVSITSGSLLNLKIFSQVGPYLDYLFIDYADFEYCLRLRENGYKIIQINNAKIYHQLGKLEKHYFLFKSIFVTHHSPFRYYYRTRNRLYIARNYLFKFPSFVLKDFFTFINELIKIIFYEKNKIEKMKMILYGFIDFIKNKYGKLKIDKKI